MSTTPQAIIHLSVPSGTGPITSVGGVDGNHSPVRLGVACDPSQWPPHVTGSAKAVTCPFCKDTDAYKAAVESQAPGLSIDQRARLRLVREAEEKAAADAAAKGDCEGCAAG